MHALLGWRFRASLLHLRGQVCVCAQGATGVCTNRAFCGCVCAQGAIGVYINSVEKTDTKRHENWVVFDAKWTDDQWHHIAVTWEYENGELK